MFPRIEVPQGAMGNGGQRQAHENQLCEFLSGGNKRKLSTARGLRSPRVLIRDVDILVGNVSFLWLCFFFFRESTLQSKKVETISGWHTISRWVELSVL